MLNKPFLGFPGFEVGKIKSSSILEESLCCAASLPGASRRGERLKTDV